MRVKQALLRFHGNPRRERVYTPFIAILNYLSNFIGHGHPNKPANGERMIRQGVGGLAIGSGAFQSLARDRDAKPDFTVVDRALDNGTLFTTGREPRSGKARQKSKRRCQMFQGHIDLDAATPVEASAVPDVLFERGLYWASGRSGWSISSPRISGSILRLSRAAPTPSSCAARSPS